MHSKQYICIPKNFEKRFPKTKSYLPTDLSPETQRFYYALYIYPREPARIFRSWISWARLAQSVEHQTFRPDITSDIWGSWVRVPRWAQYFSFNFFFVSILRFLFVAFSTVICRLETSSERWDLSYTCIMFFVKEKNSITIASVFIIFSRVC